MRYALIGLTAVLAVAGGLQAQAATDRSTPYAAKPTAAVRTTADAREFMTARNAQIIAAWGEEPFGYGVQKALVEDKIMFGNPRPEAKPLASNLPDFRQDIALSNDERERYSIISTAP